MSKALRLFVVAAMLAAFAASAASPAASRAIQPPTIPQTAALAEPFAEGWSALDTESAAHSQIETDRCLKGSLPFR
jgi:hypothetical protein